MRIYCLYPNDVNIQANTHVYNTIANCPRVGNGERALTRQGIDIERLNAEMMPAVYFSFALDEVHRNFSCQPINGKNRTHDERNENRCCIRYRKSKTIATK